MQGLFEGSPTPRDEWHNCAQATGGMRVQVAHWWHPVMVPWGVTPPGASRQTGPVHTDDVWQVSHQPSGSRVRVPGMR